MTGGDSAKENYLYFKTRLIRYLALFHFSLILLFDFLAVFAPAFMAQRLSPGTPFTFGLVFAMLIIVSVISATVLYARWVNRAESGLAEKPAGND